MVAENRAGSILVADCGTVITRAMLLDRVQGQYRLLSCTEVPTTRGEAWSGVVDGVRRAVERISAITARQLLDGDDDLITTQVTAQRGTDAFACTVSASDPLLVTIGGLSKDLSVASARRAAAGTYSQVTAILNDETGLPLSEEACLRVICSTPSDVIFIAGGIEGGAERPVIRMVETVALACSMMDPETRPTVLYAGNSRLLLDVTETVGDGIELRVAENLRPTLESEFLADAQRELQSLFVERKMNELPGLATVARWSSVSPTPTAQAFGRLVRYLWRLGTGERGVLGIDVGAANTTVAAVFDDRLHLTIRAGTGVARGGVTLLEQPGLNAVTRWHPEPVSADEARGLLMDKACFPASIPQVKHELWLEQAVAREAMRTTLEIARQGWEPGITQVYPDLMPLCDTIVASGGALAHAPRPRETVLMVLDAVQPIGMSTLMLDTYGLTPALASINELNPLAAAEVVDAGGLTTLGTVVAPVGNARRGSVVMNLTVTYESGDELDVEVHQGDLEILSLPGGQQAVVEISPEPQVDVGLGGPGAGGTRRVSGGLAGLIIDARGRPLTLPAERGERHEQIQQWLGEAIESSVLAQSPAGDEAA